jgi:predicted aldo/keto reductase-like oxidoreductase
MKTNGGGGILKGTTASAEDCQRYAMSLPVATVIRGMPTLEILQKNLEVARNFEPMTPAEMDALRARTESEGKTGELENYKAGI